MNTRATTSRHQGFTIIEMVVVVAIIGILVAVGFVLLPRDRFAVNQAAEGAARDYQFVRLEAIRRNEFLGLELLPDSHQYRVFVDVNRNLSFDAGTDDVIKVIDVSDNGVRLTGTTAGTLYFDPRGLNPNSFLGEIAVRLSNPAGTYLRFVCVNTQGRTHIEPGGCA